MLTPLSQPIRCKTETNRDLLVGVFPRLMPATCICFELGRSLTVACVASVSPGLSAGLKHFSRFERAKIGVSKKSAPLPLPAPSISVVLAIFAPPKSEKCLERAEKPTETLATQASLTVELNPLM